VGDALCVPRTAFDRHAGPGRGEHVKAFGSANLVNPEQVRSVADDDQAAQTVGSGDSPRCGARNPLNCVLSVSAMMAPSETPMPIRYSRPTAPSLYWSPPLPPG